MIRPEAHPLPGGWASPFSGLSHSGQPRGGMPIVRAAAVAATAAPFVTLAARMTGSAAATKTTV